MLNVYLTDESKNIYSEMIEKIDRKRDENTGHKYDPVYFVVPKQGKLIAEDMIMKAKGGGTMDVVTDLMGFLNIIINDDKKHSMEKIGTYGAYMLLYKIIKELESELEIYDAKTKITENIPKIYDLIVEFRKNNLLPLEMSSVSNKMADREPVLAKKLEDLYKICSRYEELSKGRFYDDQELIRRFIAGEFDLVNGGDALNQVWVLGYPALSLGEIDVITTLSERGFDVNLVLYSRGEEAERERRESLFSFTDKIIKRIKEKTRDEIQIEKIGRLRENVNREQAFLEKNLFAYNPEKYQDAPEHIFLTSCSDFRGEVRWVCDTVSELLRNEEMKLSEIALICPEDEEYQRILQLCLSKYEIGHFLDEKRSAMHSPVVECISALLDVAANGARRIDVVRLFKTGLMDLNIRDREKLELYSKNFKISGKRWHESFVLGKSIYSDEDFDRIENARKSVSGMIRSFEEQFNSANSVEAKIDVLYEFLKNQMKIMEKSQEMAVALEEAGRYDESQEMRQIWDVVTEVMSELAGILGDERIGNKDFRDLLVEGFKHISISVVPSTRDEIIVGSPDRTKIMNKKAVFIMGGNAGVLPRDMDDDRIISKNDIKKISETGPGNLVDMLDRDFAYTDTMIYEICARAEERLYFSFSRGDSDGKPLSKSTLISNLQRCFPKLRENALNEDFKYKQAEVTGYRSMEDILITSLQRYIKDGNISPNHELMLGWFLENRPEVYEKIKKGLVYSGEYPRLEKSLAKGLYTAGNFDTFCEGTDEIEAGQIQLYNILKNELDTKLTEVLGEKTYMADSDVVRVSPTRLENFSRCPFRHFMQYGLRLKEKVEYDVYGYDIGDVYHKTFKVVLDELSPKLMMFKTNNGAEEETPRAEWSYRKIAARVYHVMNEIAKNHNDGVLLSTEESKYRLKAMKRICAANVWNLIEHIKAGNIKEMLLEAEFGYGKSIPEYTVEQNSGNVVAIEGKIDRIDILKGNYIKIIDYKSGAQEFNMADALSGWKLQLMVYMLAAAQKDAKFAGKPAGMFYYNISDIPLLKVKHVKKHGVKISGKINRRFIKETMLNGVVSNDENILLQIDKIDEHDEKEHARVLPISRNKDGQIGTRKRNLFINPEEMEESMGRFKDVLNELCEELTSGEVAARPMKRGEVTTCDYCSYRGICNFDTKIAGCRYSE